MFNRILSIINIFVCGAMVGVAACQEDYFVAGAFTLFATLSAFTACAKEQRCGRNA